jgi:hypothetical protein
MRFTLYPIYWIADVADDEPFDVTGLPFDVTEDVQIEAVSDRFRQGAFDLMRRKLGEDITRIMEGVRYALVHRYDPVVNELDSQAGDADNSKSSEDLVRLVAACLRLIRPMRQHALLMRGLIHDEDGTFDVKSFDVPTLHIQEVPVVQRLFKLRNQDTNDLRGYAPDFLRAMRGDFWKFRMAVQFHELGHFQSLDWKARYSLWCSAIESIYTSHSWEHQGSLVAISRIKWFIGENTSIYAPGDLTEWETDPNVSIRDIVNALYTVRNLLAHGDRIPDFYFKTTRRTGLNSEIVILDVLLEAASFIIRSSLLRILRQGLLDHFADSDHADAYFGAQGLTRTTLRAAGRAIVPGP